MRWDPDRRPVGDRELCVPGFGQQLTQLLHHDAGRVCALFEKGVSQHTISRIRLEKFSANDDYGDFWETAADDGQKLKA